MYMQKTKKAFVLPNKHRAVAEMGLQNQLSDVSSESFLVIMAVLIGKSVSYFHSLLITILHSLGLISTRFVDADHHHLLASINDVVGSGLANLILLCDQLNLNRSCSYPNHSDGDNDHCVVCLNRFARGDHLRRLACHHVFHKDCFDGWLDHLHFNCPLCRAPLLSDDHVAFAQRRVTEDLLAWFPSQ